MADIGIVVALRLWGEGARAGSYYKLVVRLEVFAFAVPYENTPVCPVD